MDFILFRNSAHFCYTELMYELNQLCPNRHQVSALFISSV